MKSLNFPEFPTDLQ